MIQFMQVVGPVDKCFHRYKEIKNISLAFRFFCIFKRISLMYGSPNFRAFNHGGIQTHVYNVSGCSCFFLVKIWAVKGLFLGEKTRGYRYRNRFTGLLIKAAQ